MKDENEWVWEKHGLHDFIPSEWFRDPAESSGWLRIYSSVGLRYNEFRKKLASAIPDTEECPFGIDQPVGMAYGQLEGFDLEHISWTYRAQEDGQTQTVIKLHEGKLQRGNYVVFALPFQVDGRPGKRAIVKEAMDQSVAALIVHMGQNFLKEIVYEGEVNAAGLDRRSQLERVPVPQSVDGPYVTSALWEDFCAAMVRLGHTRSPKRERIKLALEYMHSAVRKERGFFEYWVSLEILCNGKAGKIAERIKECNDFKSVQEVKDATGFPRLREWRQKFFHNGQRPMLTAPVERYVQLLFLDLLRYELSLSHRGHMLTFQKNGHCDLTPIGLPDGRRSESDCGALPAHVVVESD